MVVDTTRGKNKKKKKADSLMVWAAKRRRRKRRNSEEDPEMCVRAALKWAKNRYKQNLEKEKLDL